MHALYIILLVALWLVEAKGFFSRRPLIQRRLFFGGRPADDESKARLEVKLTGPSVTTALFRAELKKELVFFRGCRGYFAGGADGAATVIAEGRTKQIARFVEWLDALKADVSERKANFQGPSLVAYVQSLEWMDAKDDLPAGFTCAEEPPALSTTSLSSDEEGEGKMVGSDESV